MTTPERFIEGLPEFQCSADALSCQVLRDEIIRLRAELERKEREWVSVKERHPSENVAVLVWLSNGDVTVCWCDGMFWDGYSVVPTHWMPLPPPPKDSP